MATSPSNPTPPTVDKAPKVSSLNLIDTVTSPINPKETQKWFTERNPLWAGGASSWQIKSILFYEKTPFQEIFVFESKHHGNVLVLDGVIQLIDAFEYPYHEILGHISCYSHLNPQKVLVVGGGDGGVIRELCKHKTVTVRSTHRVTPFFLCDSRARTVRVYCWAVLVSPALQNMSQRSLNVIEIITVRSTACLTRTHGPFF